MKTRYLLIFIPIIFIASSCAYLSSSDKLYQDARAFVKEGKPDFAFMSLNELLRQSPNYRLAAEVRFAIAEYYFDSANYSKAISGFSDFLKTYKTSKLAIFAETFLYKMINDLKWLQNKDSVEVAEMIRKEFFSKSAFFVFSEFKETKVVSIFSNKYLLKEYVDKIDIFRNGKLFISVSP